MAYNLSITEYSDEQLDNILYYLIYQFKNEQAAKHLLDEIERIYDRLEENPLQFPVCRDRYLAKRGYREAVTGQMDYVIVFSVKTDVVNIVGIFHQMENYQKKL
jgi:plasmid stabilization system protein ParE